MQIALSWLFFFQLHDRARAVWDSSLLPASLQRQTVRCCQVGRKQRDPLINLHLWLTCCREEKTKCFLGGHGVAPTVFSSAGSPLVYFTVHSHGILHLLALHWFCRRWSCSTKTQPGKKKKENEKKRSVETSEPLPLCRSAAAPRDSRNELLTKQIGVYKHNWTYLCHVMNVEFLNFAEIKY